MRDRVGDRKKLVVRRDAETRQWHVGFWDTEPDVGRLFRTKGIRDTEQAADGLLLALVKANPNDFF